MFISFFSGKVMLFFGISLIMKEKSNASALLGDNAIIGENLSANLRLQGNGHGKFECMEEGFWMVISLLQGYVFLPVSARKWVFLV